MEIPEFTCLCPKTGQPDFATLLLDYVPDRQCVELKSLKLYIWSFRDEGAFHEAVTNRILDDLARATRPRFMRLTAKFYVRGGIFTTVVAEHARQGWKPAPPRRLARPPSAQAMHALSRRGATTMNPDLDRLQSYPFQKLRRACSTGVTPSAAFAQPIPLSIGEPRHATPEFIKQCARRATSAGSRAIRRPRARRRCAKRSRPG